MVDKIKHIFIVLVFPKQISVNIKKHAVHNIHRLACGPYACWAPGNLTSVPMR